MSIKSLQTAKQLLYHATNLEDFAAYWKEQGVLSRNRLEEHCPGFTRFFSDDQDKELRVWERAFGNLNDLGGYFWRFEASTPNGYGPITLVFSDAVWSELPDIQITKRTVTSVHPEQIQPEEWHTIYEKVGKVYRLKKGYTGCEVSTSRDSIPFSSLAYILVDPIRIGGLSLRELIKTMIEVKSEDFNLTDNRLIERRISCDPQQERISHIIEWSRSLQGSLLENNRPLEDSLPEKLSEWFSGLDDWKKRIMASWLTYTYNGTLRLMESAAEMPVATGESIPD